MLGTAGYDLQHCRPAMHQVLCKNVLCILIYSMHLKRRSDIHLQMRNLRIRKEVICLRFDSYVVNVRCMILL